MKNNRNVTFVSRPCFDNMFHVIYAHEWMNNAQVHEMQVQLCKQNTRGVTKVDTTLFIKKIGKDLFVLQIYVDDIIFGSTNQDFCDEFGKMMANEFEMSMIGELSYFLGLQIKQLKNGIFVSQGKYIKNEL